MQSSWTNQFGQNFVVLLYETKLFWSSWSDQVDWIKLIRSSWSDFLDQTKGMRSSCWYNIALYYQLWGSSTGQIDLQIHQQEEPSAGQSKFR